MSYLSKFGYVIKKDSLSEDDLINLKLELRAKPLIDTKFMYPGQKEQDFSYPVYIETKSKIYIPKMYGIQKYGLPNKFLPDYIGKQWENDIEFNGELYPSQIEPVNIVLKACEENNNNGGGILQLSTGFGKSICLLYILSKLRCKSIIVVNKIPLMNQWISEINKFLPNAKVGTLQGHKNINIDGCDIVVAMLQSLTKINYPESLFVDFQATIIDESHNLASKVFSQILFKLCSKYTIGLSATPKRADGCEYVFKWHIGDIVYKNSEKRQGKPPIIQLLKIDSNKYKEVSIDNKITGQKQIVFASMLTELIEIPERNQLIIELIKDLIKKDDKRKILVLSDRRNHVQYLKELLDNDLQVNFTSGLFLGSMKQQDLEYSRACQVILATFAAFKEGVSEKELDTLILVSPKKYVGHMEQKIVKNESGSMEQIVGRIFRKDHIDRHPIIIDFQDNFSVYKTQSNSRTIFYKNHFKNGIFEESSIKLQDITDNKYIENIKQKSTKKEKLNEKEKEENLSKLLNFCVIED